MGTASKFDDVLKRELNIHAAWLPVTNTFSPGDYGLFSDGVLSKIGNITNDFNIKPLLGVGNESVLSFSSDGTTHKRLISGIEVPQYSVGEDQATLTIEFSASESFFLRGTLTGKIMSNMQRVANQLAELPSWNRRHIVVSATYAGENCTIISSKSNGSRVEVVGTTNALAQFEQTGAWGELRATTRHNIGLEVLGKAGVVGLGLFKLPTWGRNPRVLSTPDERAFVCHADENWSTEIIDSSV